ncbi:MAG TPA: hypothetical protein VM425_03710 [Myxococcota bacterium]|nr:hypothetical protein [Myxococcota bacterium]
MPPGYNIESLSVKCRCLTLLSLIPPDGQVLGELSSERGAAVEFADRKMDPRVPVLV